MTAAPAIQIYGSPIPCAQALALMSALNLRSSETAAHCERVMQVASLIGREMRYADRELELLKLGALLHDVGKLAVPDAILLKTESLTDEEWATLREHPWRGANLLSALEIPERVCRTVRQHHERWNGQGYPNGIGGRDISQQACIVAVADTYDAITRDRCYHKGESHEVAINEIDSQSGFSFDPEVVCAFLRILQRDLTAASLINQSTAEE